MRDTLSVGAPSLGKDAVAGVKIGLHKNINATIKVTFCFRRWVDSLLITSLIPAITGPYVGYAIPSLKAPPIEAP